MGNIDHAIPEAAPFAAIADPCMPRPRSNAYLLEVDARVVGGHLHVRWIHSAVYRREVIEQLGEMFAATMRQLIVRGRLSVVSAVDFAEAGLDQEQLEQFLAAIKRRQ